MISLDDTVSDLKFGDMAEADTASKQSILSLDDGGVRYVAPEFAQCCVFAANQEASLSKHGRANRLRILRFHCFLIAVPKSKSHCTNDFELGTAVFPMISNLLVPS